MNICNKSILILITLFIIIAHRAPSKADDSKKPSNFSFGFGGTIGLYNVWERKGYSRWDYGLGFGGGLLFENMFNKRIGIHSGIWYQQSKTKFTFFEPTSSTIVIKTIVKNHTFTLPLYLITSFNFSSFSINLLTGLNFSYIAKTKLINDSYYNYYNYTMYQTNYNAIDILPYLKSFNIGIAGGLNFKFKISKYTDFFIGGLAELYLTDFNSYDQRSISNIYDFRAISGFMFRTNIFPESKDESE